MILWIKRIICLPFVAMFGVMLVAMPARLLLPNLGVVADKVDTYARILAWIAAALAVWLYVRSWKKTDSQAAVPTPRRSPTSMRSGFVWALVIVIGGPFIYAMFKGAGEDAARKQQPGYAAFQSADMLLIGKSNGIAHGNTPEAQALASEFSQRMKQARKLGIESRKSSSIISLTGGEFLTYCLLTQESCVFMVHVPDLRKFTPDAKDFIAEAAWFSALAITESRQSSLRNVCVGVRGALLYDRVICGRPGSPANAASLRLTKIDGNTESQEYLQGYFAQPAPASSTAAPAPPGSK
jgi:hypothetical protein